MESTYKEVLNRPKFSFNNAKTGEIINKIRDGRIEVIPKPCNLDFADEEDRMFYEVAKDSRAILIIGNLRHYPNELFIQSAVEFLSSI